LLIQRLGVQTWDIDIEAARRAGIPVCFMPIAACQFVAEHVILQILGLLRRVRELMRVSEDAQSWGTPPRRCNEDHFAYNWSKRLNLQSLMGKTIGILGFGEIGIELAWRLKAFGCTVLYQKRNRLPPPVEDQYGLRFATRDEIAGQCDIVVALLPIGPETDQELDAVFFSAMQPGALFVQSGGSGTVSETALAAAVGSRHLGGAAVDGFTWEPLQPDNPLIALARDHMCNLILTPHVAGGSITPSGALPPRTADYANIVAMLTGGELRYRLV
jgi:phosphoglycerate dehydrogenase-like enzyme